MHPKAETPWEKKSSKCFQDLVNSRYYSVYSLMMVHMQPPQFPCMHDQSSISHMFLWTVSVPQICSRALSVHSLPSGCLPADFGHFGDLQLWPAFPELGTTVGLCFRSASPWSIWKVSPGSPSRMRGPSHLSSFSQRSPSCMASRAVSDSRSVTRSTALSRRARSWHTHHLNSVSPTAVTESPIHVMHVHWESIMQ